MGSSKKLISVIHSLYRLPQSYCGWGSLTSDIFISLMGVEQGCVMLPTLSALFIADVTNLLNRFCKGAKFGDVFVHCLLLVDDLILLSNCPVDF